MSDTHVVILAAGRDRRMHSLHAKVLHRLGGLPLVEHVLRAARALDAGPITLVIGHLAEQVRGALADQPDLQFVRQEPQLGTAHAVQQTAALFEGSTGRLLVLPADAPLVRVATLRRLLDVHRAAGAALTLVTGTLERPYGYGRVVRAAGRLARIVEESDASPAQRRIRDINSGIYVLDLPPLYPALRRIGAENAQGEHYLTDLVGIYRRRRLAVETIAVDDVNEIRGINSRSELAEVRAAVKQVKNEELMGAGVTIVDPATTYIDVDVSVGPDTVIHPNVILEGRTTIGAACEIHAGVRIVDSAIGDRAVINNFCVIVSSRVAGGARVGPFAHIRPGSEVGEGAHVGNFVELKKTVLGAGSKANHLTYLGDAVVGERVNVGAGTITCNYDGEKKHRTVIEDEVFIGSDTQLIAPVRVGKGAYVAAGSSITRDVPPGALGIARGQQVNKEGWVEKKKKR